MKKRMTYQDKFEEAKAKSIFLPEEILKRKIVGVYGFFAIKGTKKYCFYIGKSTNITSRLLKSGSGHVSNYLNGNNKKLVPRKIEEMLHLKDVDKIEVKILQEIDYRSEKFTIAAHRLALAELQEIVKYQEKGQCLEQLPEGVGDKEKKYWERNYGRN